MDASVGGILKTVEAAGDVRVERALVGLVNCRDVHFERAAAGPIAASGQVSILNGGCGPMMAGGDVSITNGGCGPLVAKGDVSITTAGRRASLRPETRGSAKERSSGSSQRRRSSWRTARRCS